MSDCSRRAWMRPNMPETKWRPLGEGVVNLPAEDEPHMAELTTRKGRVKPFPFALDSDDAVTGVSIDGERWRPPRAVDWDDLCGVD